MFKTFARGAAVTAILALTAGMSDALTVSDSFSMPRIVDGRTDIISFEVTESLTISDLDIALDFSKCDGWIWPVGATCILSGNAYLNEIVFSLTSPLGTRVDLIGEGSFAGRTGGRVTVVLDDSARTLVGGSELASGTFRPVGELADFNGEDAQGTWSILMRDTARRDPMSLNGYTATFTGASAFRAADVAAVPIPASFPMLAAGFGVLAFATIRKRNRAPTTGTS